MPDLQAPRVVLLAGGVGGARMAEGFRLALPAASLTVVVNVGDDDDFHGLRVCPDLDTVLYTLSGQVDGRQAWGVEGDTTRALGMLRRLGAPDTWMTLGDADIGLHLHRTGRLRSGASLTTVTAELAAAFGIPVAVLPVTDAPLRTRVRTEEGELRFQEWFVQRRCAPPVRSLHFDGAEQAEATAAVAAALREADLIVFAPSNPLLSILPMLKAAGVDDLVQQSCVPKLAVSPLINGVAVKGPLHRLMGDLRFTPGNAGVAEFYRGIVDALVIDSTDEADRSELESRGLRVLSAPTRIAKSQQAEALAQNIIAWFRSGAVKPGELEVSP